MQVDTTNIQRPTLFEEFFDKLVTYKNDVINYIVTSIKKLVTSKINNTKKSLKAKKMITLQNEEQIYKEIQKFFGKSFTLGMRDGVIEVTCDGKTKEYFILDENLRDIFFDSLDNLSDLQD